MTGKLAPERADPPATAVGRFAGNGDCEQHREDLLDEALEETFPASDPPSIAQPPGKGC